MGEVREIDWRWWGRLRGRWTRVGGLLEWRRGGRMRRKRERVVRRGVAEEVGSLKSPLFQLLGNVGDRDAWEGRSGERRRTRC